MTGRRVSAMDDQRDYPIPRGETPPCAEVGDDIFFPEVGGTYNRWADRQAKQVCMGCPFRTACAEYALARPALEGSWGGLTQDERRELRAQGRAGKQAGKIYPSWIRGNGQDWVDVERRRRDREIDRRLYERDISERSVRW